jgi:hypothetical protein
MAVYKLSGTSVKNGRTEYSSFLAGNPAATFSSFESIATVTVGSGGTAYVEFDSIPSTYTHLQIRILSRTTQNGANGESILLRFNGDTGTNYSDHTIRTYFGAETGLSSYGEINQGFINIGASVSNSLMSNLYAATVIDILDYGNTNKYKTTRTMNGYDFNGATSGYSYLQYAAGSWRNTNAINTIRLTPDVSNFSQYSSIALYGIKGA